MSSLPDGFGPSIKTDYQDLKMMVKEFFEIAPSATPEQLDNGFKCFILACVGCEFTKDFIGNVQKESELPVLRRMVEREYQKHRFGITAKDQA